MRFALRFQTVSWFWLFEGGILVVKKSQQILKVQSSSDSEKTHLGQWTINRLFAVCLEFKGPLLRHHQNTKALWKLDGQKLRSRRRDDCGKCAHPAESCRPTPWGQIKALFLCCARTRVCSSHVLWETISQADYDQKWKRFLSTKPFSNQKLHNSALLMANFDWVEVGLFAMKPVRLEKKEMNSFLCFSALNTDATVWEASLTTALINTSFRIGSTLAKFQFFLLIHWIEINTG